MRSLLTKRNKAYDFPFVKICEDLSQEGQNSKHQDSDVAPGSSAWDGQHRACFLKPPAGKGVPICAPLGLFQNNPKQMSSNVLYENQIQTHQNAKWIHDRHFFFLIEIRFFLGDTVVELMFDMTTSANCLFLRHLEQPLPNRTLLKVLVAASFNWPATLRRKEHLGNCTFLAR